MFKRFIVMGLMLTCLSAPLTASKYRVEPCERICGKWRSEKKNCIVQVYRDNDDYKAKLVWFDDSDDPTRPMDTRVDDKNPEKSLRNRKLIGMNVVEDLEYKPKTDSWENGMIYDAQSGKKWNSSAEILPDGAMKVTGYWHFKFIGRSMNFYRVLSNHL